MGALTGVVRRHPARGAVLVAAAVLALSAALALVMHNGDAAVTGIWDNTSQDLVFGRMLQMQQGQHAPGGFLGTYPGVEGAETDRYLFWHNMPTDPATFEVYPHQSGLQGWAQGMLNKALGPVWPGGEEREKVLYTVNSTLFYAATLGICLFVGSAWGALPALVWLASVLFSPWLQTGMKDIYWCLWLWWLPALAGLALCALSRRRGRTPAWAYALPFAAACIRCLCGFEFISVFLILSEIPLVYSFAQYLAAGRLAGPWLGRMVGAGAAGLGGTAAALGVWLMQGRLYFGSWAGSAANIAGIAGQRVSLSDGSVSGVSVGQVLHFYLLEDKTPLLQLGGLAVTLPLLGGLCLAALALSALWLARRDRRALKELVPALCVWVLSFAAPLSWLVLSKAHSAAHPHLIPMLWQFAFVPVSCALLAWLLKTFISSLRR